MAKIYFASDFHLGLDARLTSDEREAQVVRWLLEVGQDAAEIYLVGDLFDFWFEYRTVVPRGHVRLLGTLAMLRDRGVEISAFTGNHDMWLFSYFEEELGIPVFRAPIRRKWNGKSFLIGHGDGLGPGDHGYKLIKAVFASKICQWLFARLHPNFAFRIARFWSAKSRAQAQVKDDFKGKDQEWLVQYANDYVQTDPVDYFIFGHRHLPIDCLLDNGSSRYVNLGDWLHHNSYAVFDGSDLVLKFFEHEDGKVLHL